MIDVKATIFKTLNITFDRMRLLGENKPKVLKKLMFLTVLDDIYDWSDYLEENQSVQKRLQELRTNFILCNPEFEICRFPFDQHYVNVNTPQTNYTWKRVWDAPDVIILSDSFEEEIGGQPESFEPDPTCEIKLVYYGTEDAREDGAPDLNIGNLTTCEKMNIYVNRDAGTMWYLTTDCIWKQIDFGSTSWTEDEILDVVKNKLKIHHFQEDEVADINAILSRTDNDPIEFCTDQEVEDLV